MSNINSDELEHQVITIGTAELGNTIIKDIPWGSSIEIADLVENGVYHRKFEGEFGWNNNKFCAFVSHDWYRKYWDLPLSLAFHMDLMKRLAEFRSNQTRDISRIEYIDEGDWCRLNYDIIIPDDKINLEEALLYANSILNWIYNTVQTAQDGASRLMTDIIEKYNETSLLALPELINQVKTTTDIDRKGKLLEELVARFFSEISGFNITERKRTKTEEIDIVIMNKSEDNFWKSESSLILVECKNWANKPAGKNEYVAFREKLENRRGRAKIGFFISGKGFAKTFGLEDLRNSKEDLLIVPVDLRKFIEIIETHKNYSEELQKLCVEATTK